MNVAEMDEAPPLNAYKFATLRSLRACLRSFSSLSSLTNSGDFESATILFDLAGAINDPLQRTMVLTPRQKQAITLHLIQDKHVSDVSREMGVTERVVYLLVNTGLRRLLSFLQVGVLPQFSGWKQWEQWQIDYVRHNAGKSRKEIGERVGRSEDAVRVLICRLRKGGERLETGSRRNLGCRPALERQSA